MLTLTHFVQDAVGMHARPAALIAKTIAAFQSTVTLTAKGKTVNGKSMMGLMSLGLKQGEEMAFRIEGPDEVQAAEALKTVLP